MTVWECVASDTGGTVAGLAVATLEGRSVVFAATPVGVFRSMDAGASWALPGLQGTVAFAEALAVSTRFAEDHVVFACGRDGVYRSTDSGQTWQLVLTGSRMLGIATSTASTGQVQVLAATETDGVLRSTDGGVTWSGANAGLLDLTAMCLGVSAAWENDHRGFVGTASGLYRTRNGAKSWRAVETGLDDPAVQCLAVSPTFSADGLVLAGTEANGILRSEDGGATWDCPPDLGTDGVMALAFADGYPKRPTIAAATTSGVAISRDGGQSWQLAGSGPGRVLSLLWVEDTAGELLLAGLERLGVARSRDAGASWEFSNTGLSASLLTGLSLSPAFAHDRTLFAVGLDSGVNVSEDAGQTWTQRNDGLDDSTTVLGLAVSPTYASDRSLSIATTTGVYVSRDAATTWTVATSTPVRAIASGSADGPLAAASASGLLVSNDGAQNWRLLDTPFGEAELVTLAVSPAHDRNATIFAATSKTGADGAREIVVWRGENGGAQWSRWLVERSGMGVGSGDTVVALTVSPNYQVDQLVFVGLAGRVLTPLSHAHEVHARQRRPVWHRARLATPDVAITSLALSPSFARDGTVFAASNAGVFVSHDAGHTFHSLSEGLVPPRMVAVAVSPAYDQDHQVYALGLGGTVWQTTLAWSART